MFCNVQTKDRVKKSLGNTLEKYKKKFSKVQRSLALVITWFPLRCTINDENIWKLSCTYKKLN